MRRSASLRLILLLCLATATCARATAPDAIQAYQVRLQLSRDGVSLPVSLLTVEAGEPARFELDCPKCGVLRVHQRVTAFPGSQGKRVLIELELFRLRDGRTERLVAPTLGARLGRLQLERFRTDIGLIEVRVAVHQTRSAAISAEVRAIPADRDLDRWLNPPGPPLPLT